MENKDNLTFEEVKKKIEEFEASKEFKLLTAPNFLQIAGKSRSETAFTSLFAWVLSNHKFNELEITPINSFLSLLVHKAKEQEKESGVVLMDTKIIKAIESNKVKIDIIDYKTEYAVCLKKRKKCGKGKVDLLIICDFSFENKHYPLAIIIENKIDHTEKNDQCKVYYDYFKEKPEIKINEKRHRTCKDVQDLYVFSSIEKPDPTSVSCSQYIFITHKDIYDKILLPIKYSISGKPGFSLEELYLNEYMSALTTIKTEGKFQIVKDESMQKVLKDFYLLHHDFIDRVIIEGCGDSHLKNSIIKYRQNKYSRIEEDIRTLYERYFSENEDLIVSLMSEGCECKEVREALQNRRKSFSILYEIYFQGDYIIETNQSSLLGDLVKDYMERFQTSRENVQSLLDKKIGAVFVDDNDYGFELFEINGMEYKISNQRTRYPWNIKEIKRVFDKKGYEIIQL